MKSHEEFMEEVEEAITIPARTNKALSEKGSKANLEVGEC